MAQQAAKRQKRVVLGVTGSIAAYKAADLVRRLQDQNCDVHVVMTKEAEHFITPLTLATLSGNKVYRDMFEPDGSSWSIGHIALAKEADAVVIAPATANMIAKLAHGLADDLISAMVLATAANILIAPAMNDEMYSNAIVKENCKKLKSVGMSFIEPVKGKLACGSFGEGHLADVDEIVKAVKRLKT